MEASSRQTQSDSSNPASAAAETSFPLPPSQLKQLRICCSVPFSSGTAPSTQFAGLFRTWPVPQSDKVSQTPQMNSKELTENEKAHTHTCAGHSLGRSFFVIPRCTESTTSKISKKKPESKETIPVIEGLVHVHMLETTAAAVSYHPA